MVLKIPTKKIRKTRKLEYIKEKHFVERKNVGRKSDKTRVWEDLSLLLKTSTKMPFKNSISGADLAKKNVLVPDPTKNFEPP